MPSNPIPTYNDVGEALAKLGDTSDAIAYSLLLRGTAGVPNDCTACILVRYLAEIFRGHEIEVQPNGSFGALHVTFPSAHREYQYRDSAIVPFTVAFDDLEYPELTEWAAKLDLVCEVQGSEGWTADPDLPPHGCNVREFALANHESPDALGAMRLALNADADADDGGGYGYCGGGAAPFTRYRVYTDRDSLAYTLADLGFETLADVILEWLRDDPVVDDAGAKRIPWRSLLSDLAKDVEYGWHHVGEDEDRPRYDAARNAIAAARQRP